MSSESFAIYGNAVFVYVGYEFFVCYFIEDTGVKEKGR